MAPGCCNRPVGAEEHLNSSSQGAAKLLRPLLAISICYNNLVLLAGSRPAAMTDQEEVADLYLEASVEEETLKKVVLHSVATALASMVLPVPGGPNIRTPCIRRQPWSQ